MSGSLFASSPARPPRDPRTSSSTPRPHSLSTSSLFQKLSPLKGIILSDASLAEKKRSLETGKRAKKQVSFQSPSVSPPTSPISPQRPNLSRDDLYHYLYQIRYFRSHPFSRTRSHSLPLPSKHSELDFIKMLQVSLPDVLDDQSSAIGDLKHQLGDVSNTLQTSVSELEDLSTFDMDQIRDSFTHGSTIRPRSLTLPSSIDTHPFTHTRSRSVSASPVTYQPTSTSDFPSPPTTPPTEETDSNARFDRIFDLLNGLIGEGKEALESEGEDILQRKPSLTSLRHSRSSNFGEAARPRSCSSGRSSRLSMRSESCSHSGSSDDGESFQSNVSHHPSVESDEESELSEFSDNAVLSPSHSQSSTSDSEANGKVEAFRRSLNEIDRVDLIADSDAEKSSEGNGEEDEDNIMMTHSPTRNLSQSSPIQTYSRALSQSPDRASSHHVQVVDEWDDDDPPLSAYMDSPSRNSGRAAVDLSAENPLLQSIKRVDTNLRRIERLSLELFHDEDELPYDEDYFNDGEAANDSEVIAARVKSLASMRWALKRNLARLLFDSFAFILAYLICSPWLIEITCRRVVIAFGLAMAIVNQLNRFSRIVWRPDSTEMPGSYSVEAFNQLIHLVNEHEHTGLYHGLSMHLSDTTTTTKEAHRLPFMPSYAKTRFNPTSALITPPESPQYALRRSPFHHHHHHHFTCDGCMQKLEVIMEDVPHDHLGHTVEDEAVARLGRYNEMPGRRDRRMSV